MKRTFTKYPSGYVKASRGFPEDYDEIEYRDVIIYYNYDGDCKYSVEYNDGEFSVSFNTLDEAKAEIDDMYRRGDLSDWE